jgi:hypothetical protein
MLEKEKEEKEQGLLNVEKCFMLSESRNMKPDNTFVLSCNLRNHDVASFS